MILVATDWFGCLDNSLSFIFVLSLKANPPLKLEKYFFCISGSARSALGQSPLPKLHGARPSCNDSITFSGRNKTLVPPIATPSFAGVIRVND
jgi:hypothetical protein